MPDLSLLEGAGILLAGIAVGCGIGWRTRSGHEVIETDHWRAEHHRHWGGTEDWHLEYDRKPGVPEATSTGD